MELAGRGRARPVRRWLVLRLARRRLALEAAPLDSRDAWRGQIDAAEVHASPARLGRASSAAQLYARQARAEVLQHVVCAAARRDGIGHRWRQDAPRVRT